eukprot:CAMPEP_0117421592 /NCGR_PEP_ID=MMETSP0758-20121206/2635_1 /TAXON_ID=63605 /ORGANISM="Percolomonas cosmopolitus, Strain AE-1 (ATCC 50343)" /LENGTH=753 /DNA_ID=CAMNT_0005203773 /DNA_START=739 /DNA_END=2997 /DNA_ORIENTATION=+
MGDIHLEYKEVKTAGVYYSKTLYYAKRIESTVQSDKTILLFEKFGIYHMTRGNFIDALDAFKRAKKINENAINSLLRSVVLHFRIGKAYLALKDFIVAMHHFQESRSLLSTLNSSDDALGDTVLPKNVHFRSIDRIITPTQLSNQVDHRIITLLQLSIDECMGDVLLNQNQYHKAIGNLRRTIALSLDVKHAASEIAVREKLALCYAAVKQYQHAIDEYLLILNIIKSKDKAIVEIRIVIHLGMLYYHHGYPSKALRFYHQAIDQAKTFLLNKKNKIQELNEVGHMLLKAMRRSIIPQHYFENALHTSIHLLELSKRLAMVLHIHNLENTRFLKLVRRSKNQQALDDVEDLLDINVNMGYLHQALDHSYAEKKQTEELSVPSNDVIISPRTMELESDIPENPFPNPEHMIFDDNYYESLLVADAEQKQEPIGKKLVRPDYTLPSLDFHFPPFIKQVVYYFIDAHQSLYIWILRSTTPVNHPQHPKIIAHHRLKLKNFLHKDQTLYSLLQDQEVMLSVDSLQLLYNCFIGSIVEDLNPNHILTIIPPISGIPWNALMNPNGDFLIEKFTVSIATSIEQLELVSKRREEFVQGLPKHTVNSNVPKRRFLLVTKPYNRVVKFRTPFQDHHKLFYPLFSKKGSCGVDGIGVHTISYTDVSKKNLFSSLEKEKPAILHIDTYTEGAPDTLESLFFASQGSLLFENSLDDGKLSVDTIREASFPCVELVSCSGTSSSTVFSIVNAFILGGARSLIASNW